MPTATGDYRLDWILHEGDTIQTADATYTITGEPIGFGGSSVLYQAVKNGSKKKYAIKECFPGQPEYKDSFERPRGIVCAKSPSAQALLNRYRAALLKEEKIGEIIWNSSRRAIGIQEKLNPVSVMTKGKVYSDVSDGVFCLMERIDQKAMSFDSVIEQIKQSTSTEESQEYNGPPKIYMTVCLIEQVLRALKQIHDARDPDNQEMQGYYYGDIHPGNIYFTETDVAKGYVGIAHLLDFGSSWELDKDGKTALLTYKDVFSTNGFCPPQLRQNSPFQLTKKADVYSVGCLLLKCVISPNLFLTFGSSPQVGRAALNEKAGRAIGCTGKALKTLNDILYKSIGYNSDESYADASEMLDAIQELKKYTEQPSFLLSANLSTPECFDLVLESRKEDMRHIDAALTQNKQAYVWGFPGLGKTELSVAYARTYNPDKSYLVRYKESMRDTIIGLQFTDMDDPDLYNLSKDERAIAEEKIYRKKIDELKKYPSDSLLIIDNFDSKTKTFQEMIQEPAYYDLLGINMRLLITTRSQPDDVTPEIQPLKEEYLLKLMKRFIGSKKVSEDLLLQLLDACGYHTLSAELIGKAIGNKLKPASPEYILQKLRDNQLKQAVLPKSRTSKDRVFDIDTIYGHLKTLFDIACLSEKEKAIMCHAALLPTNGIQTCIFLRAECSEENHLAVEQLISKGWLHVSQEQIISVHPLVCDLVNEEIGISYEKCKLFLYWLFDGAVNDQMYRISTASSRAWSDDSDNPFDRRKQLVEQFGYIEYSNPLEEYEDCKRLSHMIAEVFANASLKIPNWSIPYATDAAYCFDMAHNQELCLKYSHQALDNLIKKTKANPDSDWHKLEIFTTDERWAILQLRRTWCPELEERLWDIEYAELYGNELFMDHSQKPIEVQSIYAKLRYLLIRDQ